MTNKLPSLNIRIGGLDENIGDVAHEFDTELIVRRDPEGRFLRNYQ